MLDGDLATCNAATGANGDALGNGELLTERLGVVDVDQVQTGGSLRVMLAVDVALKLVDHGLCDLQTTVGVVADNLVVRHHHAAETEVVGVVGLGNVANLLLKTDCTEVKIPVKNKRP